MALMTMSLYIVMICLCGSTVELRTGVGHMSLPWPLTSSLPCQPQTLFVDLLHYTQSCCQEEWWFYCVSNLTWTLLIENVSELWIGTGWTFSLCSCSTLRRNFWQFTERLRLSHVDGMSGFSDSSSSINTRPHDLHIVIMMLTGSKTR